jgi:hypothetical protein
MEVAVCSAPCSAEELFKKLPVVRCTHAEFMAAARLLTSEEARVLLTATLHRSMAYAKELAPLDVARRLALCFVEAAGPGAMFYSSSDAADEVTGVNAWRHMLTEHTFEAVLYCEGKDESAMLVLVDED